MIRAWLLAVAICLALGGAAAAQQVYGERNIAPMPLFTPPPASAPPAPATRRTVDANGNAVDTTETYRSGPFGTYSDHTTITTYPPGNPAQATSTIH